MAAVTRDSTSPPLLSNCLDKDTGLPKGSYLDTIRTRCRDEKPDSDSHAIETCLRLNATYISSLDRLFMFGTATTLFESPRQYLFSRFLNNACAWVEKGMDIAIAGDVELQRLKTFPFFWIYPGAYNTLLLRPANRDESALSMILNLAYAAYRDRRFAGGTHLLRKQCGLVYSHPFSHSITAICAVEYEVLMLELPNAFQCIDEGLDIVRVGKGLYCLDVAKTLGIAFGMNLIPPMLMTLSDWLDSLIYFLYQSNHPSPEKLAAMKAMNQFIRNNFELPVLNTVERVALRNGLLANSYPSRFSNLASFRDRYYKKAVYKELLKAGLEPGPGRVARLIEIKESIISKLSGLYRTMYYPKPENDQSSPTQYPLNPFSTP
ncbi:MAG: hypothetical protein ACR2PT_05775 [Endozoicomonas sp.]